MSRSLKILVAIVIVLGLVVLISIIHHYRLRAAVNDYIAELKAKGEPMELAQVIPPRIPTGQNGAEILRHAAAFIDTDTGLSYSNYIDGMEMVEPGKAIVCWQQPDIRDVYGTNSWKEVQAAVNQNENSFILLHQLVARPNFDFRTRYDLGVADLEFTNLYLAQSKEDSLRLQTAAICELQGGEMAAAVEDLRTILALVKAMRDERLVISQLVRMAIANIAVSASWELLQSSNVTDEQLADLQRDWTGLGFTKDYENALEMERVIGAISLRRWRGPNSELQRYLEIGREARESLGLSNKDETFWNKAERTSKFFFWRYWWSYPDQLRALKGYEVLLNSTRLAEKNHSFQTALGQQESQLAALGINKLGNDFAIFMDPERMDMHSMLSQSILVLSETLRHAMKVEAARKMVTTAITLKRYDLKHGNFPDNLNSLVPEFVARVPLDPVDGRPLRYRRNADGTFLLYSVGENGKDDGGNPEPEKGAESSNFYWLDSHALDWVWPQPATAQEVQRYYSRQKSKD